MVTELPTPGRSVGAHVWRHLVVTLGERAILACGGETPVTPRPPPKKTYPAPNVNSTEAEELCAGSNHQFIGNTEDTEHVQRQPRTRINKIQDLRNSPEGRVEGGRGCPVLLGGALRGVGAGSQAARGESLWEGHEAWSPGLSNSLGGK